jgi:predicted transcriptional regulator
VYLRNLHERLNLAKTVLKELNRQTLSRTQLEKRTVRKFGTHATFEGIFSYLVKNGYVIKSDQKHRAPYMITEKGTKLLEGL